ncbi:hypothetical protein [Solimonas sp. SE-A11]|uniref:tetratricopeptide repeat protein n=1 Tax=Solimonas sp. SE-A11 TaxID=3054954 RepID=UPI00259D00C5|nr:hypothetical protein [Solimonas sp. SE-A11]MDM4772868.1 hypothetical protein [Solimonas sp. SE-A11]
MKATLSKRRMIPKWRPVAKSLQSPEVAPLKPKPVDVPRPNAEEFEIAQMQFEKNPTAGHFGDLLAFSVFPECVPAVRDIAKAAISKGVSLSSAQRAIAGIVAADADIEVEPPLCLEDKKNPFSELLQDHRRLLKANPENPLLLLDFAQLQLAGGNTKSAEKSLRLAQGMLPDHPLVLRTVARFLVHVDKKYRAHALIASHPSTKLNPWLMASELALADVAGVKPKFYGAAKKVIDSGRFPDRHIAELAAAISSHQLSAGHPKEARRSFTKAVLAPNDNVAAQIVTDQRDLNISLNTQGLIQVIEATHEANALVAASRGQHSAAIKSAQAWLCEEPFSSRPAQFLSSVYVYNEDPQRALEVAKVGLRADPNEVGLLINACYLHALLGDLEASAAAGRRAVQLDRNLALPFIYSTYGMLSILAGDYEHGESLYRDAMHDFERTGRNALKGLCATFFAQTAVRANLPKAEDILQEAIELVRKYPCPESVTVLSKLTKRENLPVSRMRLFEQYVYHPSTNTLVRTSGVTSPGAPLIIWANE